MATGAPPGGLAAIVRAAGAAARFGGGKLTAPWRDGPGLVLVPTPDDDVLFDVDRPGHLA